MALNLGAVGQKIGPSHKDYTWKDLSLYALGVGAGFDELDYIYESSLKPLPSYSIAAIFDFLAEAAILSEADLSGVLHGEQDIIFHNPIPLEGRFITEGAITHIYDKGPKKGAVVIVQADTLHSDGQKLFTNIFKLFCRKDGGFGGENAPGEVVEIPSREPDFVVEQHPGPDQPLLYRLTGDVFALHVDPEFAKRSGFEKPIMHGLCTHGFACRAVIANLIPGEPERLSRFRVRFSRTLYPGVPITTRIWKTGDTSAVFQTVNSQSGEVVLDGGIAEWLTPEQYRRRQSLGAINFDGRVAVVTGAGAGLGKAYALELARRGAKVVVNDLGGARDGSGQGTAAADQVVEEIKKAGGEAVANYDSVSTPEGGQAIVDTAVKAYGRLDVLINNAGILRDKTLVKMEADNWDAVMDVHLNGAYYVTRPAFQVMKEQGYGRIVFTTSAAGLYGNFGQTNYSAAKLGLVGFMNTLKLEGERCGVVVNSVAPLAGTRLTEDVLPPDMFQKLSPEFVAPFVAYLSSEQCGSSGGVYNAAMGYFNRAAMVTGPGAVVGGGNPPSVEEVAGAMAAICKLEPGEEFISATAALTPMMDAFSPKKAAAAAPAAEKAGGVAGVFQKMPQAFQAGAAAGVEVTFQYSISGPQGGEWFAEIKDGACKVGQGRHGSPTTTIKMADQDFLKLISGELNAMSAFTGGKLKIEGDLMKSQLIEKLFKF